MRSNTHVIILYSSLTLSYMKAWVAGQAFEEQRVERVQQVGRFSWRFAEATTRVQVFARSNESGHAVFNHAHGKQRETTN